MYQADYMEAKVKAKGLFQGQQYPIDFTSPLQLEAYLHRIEHVQSSRQFNMIAKYDAEADAANFRVLFFRQRRVVGQAWGTIKRWNGTLTRVQGTSETISELPHSFWRSSLFWMVFLFVFTPLYFRVMLSRLGENQANFCAPLILFILLITIYRVYYLLVLRLSRYLNHRALMHQLRQTFRET